MKDSTIISEDNFQKARNKILEAKREGKKVIFCGDDELGRKVLEKEKIDVLLIKLGGRKDRTKQRDSGFNQVMAKLASKGKVKIGINLDEILHSNKNEKAKIIARVEQNIELCKKAGLKMVFIQDKDEKNDYDLRVLGLSLGMPTWMPAAM